MQVKSALREMKNYLKDHKYSAIPTAALDADAAYAIHNYAVTGNPKALVVGILIGAAALFEDWIVYDEYKQDLKSIKLREDIENSEQIIQALGL